MRFLKNAYLMFALILLMVLRLFANGSWFSTIVFSGFIVAWYDIMNKVILSNKDIVSNQQKQRFAKVFIILNIVFFVFLAAIIVDLVTSCTWLDNTTLLDEITLLTLLVSLPQSQILEWINGFISGESEENYVGNN